MFFRAACHFLILLLAALESKSSIIYDKPACARLNPS